MADKKTKSLEYVVSGGLSRTDTMVVITELKKIEERDGIIHTKAVVEEARAPKSPLHRFFEWDNQKAAESFRHWQARQLIARVYVRDGVSENTVPVRAFVNLRTETGDVDDGFDRGYLSQSAVLRSPGLQQQVLDYARDQLLAWRKRFGGFEIFYGVTKAIDEITSKKEDVA